MTVQEWIDSAGPVFVRAHAVEKSIVSLARGHFRRGDLDSAHWLLQVAAGVQRRAASSVARLTERGTRRAS